MIQNYLKINHQRRLYQIFYIKKTFSDVRYFFVVPKIKRSKTPLESLKATPDDKLYLKTPKTRCTGIKNALYTSYTSLFTTRKHIHCFLAYYHYKKPHTQIQTLKNTILNANKRLTFQYFIPLKKTTRKKAQKSALSFPAKSIKKQKAPTQPTLSSTSNTHMGGCQPGGYVNDYDLRCLTTVVIDLE